MKNTLEPKQLCKELLHIITENDADASISFLALRQKRNTAIGKKTQERNEVHQPVSVFGLDVTGYRYK